MKLKFFTILFIIGILTPIFTLLYAQSWELINIYPHDPSAFTQGLVLHDGVLYESTGLYGVSDVRISTLETAKIFQSRKLPKDIFGEGLCIIGEKVYQLSWKAQNIYTYDLKLTLLETQKLPLLEGWGCTTNGSELIVSDGTSTITFLNPLNMKIVKSIVVKRGFERVNQLNELEWIEGNIFANIWQTNSIVVINPINGQVVQEYDFTILKEKTSKGSVRPIDTFNGIAWNNTTRSMLVTGKLWPYIYEVKLNAK